MSVAIWAEWLNSYFFPIASHFFPIAFHACLAEVLGQAGLPVRLAGAGALLQRRYRREARYCGRHFVESF